MNFSTKFVYFFIGKTFRSCLLGWFRETLIFRDRFTGRTPRNRELVVSTTSLHLSSKSWSIWLKYLFVYTSYIYYTKSRVGSSTTFSYTVTREKRPPSLYLPCLLKNPHTFLMNLNYSTTYDSRSNVTFIYNTFWWYFTWLSTGLHRLVLRSNYKGVLKSFLTLILQWRTLPPFCRRKKKNFKE